MSDPNAQLSAVLEELETIELIDCDAHFTEPPDLWTSRAPASRRSTMPVQRTADGKTAWFLGDSMWASTGGNTVGSGGTKVLGEGIIQPFDAIDESAWSVKARLELMDREGIFAQVIYPNAVGFSSNHVFAIDDLSLRREVLRIYNDFYVELQKESGGRLLPQGLLPVWDMDFCIDEMERLLAEGMRGFTLSDKPELLGLPELAEAYWDPMWDLFNQSGAVPNFHIGSGARREEKEAQRSRLRGAVQTVDGDGLPTRLDPAWRRFGPQRTLTLVGVQGYMSNARIIANLCMSDLFDRYPQLKVVSAESGIGWIPFLLDSLDYQFEEMVTDASERGEASRRPTEYFHDHIYAMFWFERVHPNQVERIGVDRILLETDIPHPTCLYPNARERLARATLQLEPEQRQKIFRDNALALYGIDAPSRLTGAAS